MTVVRFLWLLSMKANYEKTANCYYWLSLYEVYMGYTEFANAH